MAAAFISRGGILHVIDSLITENSADEAGAVCARHHDLSRRSSKHDRFVQHGAQPRGGAVAQGIEMTCGRRHRTRSHRGGSGRRCSCAAATSLYAYVSGGLFGIQGHCGTRALHRRHTVQKSSIPKCQVFSTDGNALLIANNTASVRGGAIDVQPNYSTGLGGFPGSGTTARALLRNVDIRYNLAPVGAAINLSHVNYGPFGSQAMGGGLYFSPQETSYPVHPSAAPCPVGRAGR